MERAWGEVSGAPEHIARKMGMPIIPNTEVERLINKPIRKHDDGEHYSRPIGGKEHTKMAVGYPKDRKSASD